MHHIFSCLHSNVFVFLSFSLSLVVVGDLPYMNLAFRSLSKTAGMISISPFLRRQGLLVLPSHTHVDSSQAVVWSRELYSNVYT